jgi:D-serine deaminase-like pyridoxal phosphate-dependent protein
MAALPSVEAYPLCPSSALQNTLVGQSLQDVPTPAAIIDIAKAQKNCSLMLESTAKLGVKFRAHVKTHKTTELTRLQVGADCKDVRLVVSTVIEAENLVPSLLDYQSKGATVNILYGVPLGASHIERLASIGQTLGPGSISMMIDHPDQLKALQRYAPLAGSPPSIFIKANAGTFRAGISPTSPQMQHLVRTASDLEQAGVLLLQGFYSHAGHSYSGSSPSDAMSMLTHEITTSLAAASILPRPAGFPPLTISVGASPTILSIQNLFSPSSTDTPAARQLVSLLQSASQSFTLELHAGVYPLLDMQQNATHARPSPTSDIALTVLAEVSSLYPSRTPSKPEALISAGCLALAREPCKDYPGWGVVSPWGVSPEAYDPETNRMVVARISQEHGILAYEGDAPRKELPLVYGQKVRIWPNHACITGACYGFYVVVDSSSGEPDRVVDVWVRWRGW